MSLMIKDIQKTGPEGMLLNRTLDVREALQERNPEVLDLSLVRLSGHASVENNIYVLTYEMAYTITLPSSRSLQPVSMDQSVEVNEVFIQQAQLTEHKDLVDQDLAMVLDGDSIDLVESVVDNILMSIPLKVLTPEEEAGAGLASGNDWEILSEEAYEARRAEEKEANNPFSALGDLFDQESMED